MREEGGGDVPPLPPHTEEGDPPTSPWAVPPDNNGHVWPSRGVVRINQRRPNRRPLRIPEYRWSLTCKSFPLWITSVRQWSWLKWQCQYGQLFYFLPLCTWPLRAASAKHCITSDGVNCKVLVAYNKYVDVCVWWRCRPVIVCLPIHPANNFSSREYHHLPRPPTRHSPTPSSHPTLLHFYDHGRDTGGGGVFTRNFDKHLLNNKRGTVHNIYFLYQLRDVGETQNPSNSNWEIIKTPTSSEGNRQCIIIPGRWG